MVEPVLIKLAAAAAGLGAGGATAFAVTLVIGYPFDAMRLNTNSLAGHILIPFVAGVTLVFSCGVGVMVNRFVKQRFGLPPPPSRNSRW